LRNGQTSLEHTTPDASILLEHHPKHLQQPSQIVQDYSTINDQQMLDLSKNRNLPGETQAMMRMSQQSNQVSSSNPMMLNSEAVKRDKSIFTM